MFSRLHNILHPPETNQPSSSCYTGYRWEERGGKRVATAAKPTTTGEDVQIDNSSTVITKIANLYAERLMSDITLVVGGMDYPAHRLILCASSDVFQVMLMNPNWSESQETRVILQETSACAAVFGDFLRYLYTGKLRINHVTVMAILSLADKYNVKDLMNLCVDYMCSHVVYAATQNQLVHWLQYTLACGHDKVAKACQNFIKWNFSMVANMNDFANIELEVLIHLLQENDLVVYDELSLYYYIENWLRHQEVKMRSECETDLEKHMKDIVIEVMSHIRFPMMSPRQLADLLLSDLTKKYKEFFVERMAIGMSFHSGQHERIQEVATSEPNGHLLFTPRLYTAEKWSAALIIENFRALSSYQNRTLVFSSPSSCAEYEGDRSLEWVVDLFPKGVWFRKFFLIVWQGTVEVPEVVLRTVRLSVTCKEAEEAHVKIGVLISGTQNGIEHVRSVVERNFLFNRKEKVVNMDDLLAFEELNSSKERSMFLIGPNLDTLKIHLIITPLNIHSSC